MKDLIERLEKAAAPDRELDNLIWFWLGQPLPDDCADCPARYTASLDAALTLVPEGWAAILYTENRQAELYRTKLAVRRGIVVRVSDRPSVAIALTIAALKARMAAERDSAGELVQRK